MYSAGPTSRSPNEDDYVAPTPPPFTHVRTSSLDVPPPRRRHTRRTLTNARILKLAAILVSLGFMAALLALLALYITSTDRPEATGIRMGTMAQTKAYLAKEYPKDVKLLFVYTGLYVKSVRFDDSNSVTLSGYIWQRYEGGIPKGVTPGVAFPEASNTYGLDEVYREKDVNGYAVVGWHFEIQTRQGFDYSIYPLDRQSVWLRMWHADFDSSGALLVPDLDGYPPWVDEDFNGVDKETVFDEWVPNYTFFAYHKIPYNSSFGYGKFVKSAGRPELYFNMGFKRGIFGAFVGNLIPMIFVSLIMFASLFPGSVHPDRAEDTGFSTMGVMAFTVTMLLVVVVQHSSIRSAVGGSALSYLDYLMFVLYAVILLVTLNAILVRSRKPVRWILWRDNLAPKLLYWPVLLGLALLATQLSLG